MGEVVKFNGHERMQHRVVDESLRGIFAREGLTDFHLNQISVNHFGGTHWLSLSLSDKRRLMGMLNMIKFNHLFTDKPAPDYPDEPGDEPA